MSRLRRAAREVRASFMHADGIISGALDAGQYLELTTIGTSYGLVINPDRNREFAEIICSNPVVGGAVAHRMRLFSELRFIYQDIDPDSGRPGNLHAHPRLELLNRPSPDTTLPALLRQTELDVSATGNAFWWRVEKDRIEIPDPRQVQRVLMEVRDAEERLLYRKLTGYLVETEPRKFVPVEPGLMMHYAPRPHPTKRGWGISWIEQAFRDIAIDGAVTEYVSKFFERAATPNLVIRSEKKLTDDQFDRLQEMAEVRYSGVQNAHKTMILEGGATVEKVGSMLKDLGLKDLGDVVENRVVLASDVPAPVLGVQVSSNPTYNNQKTAWRAFGDTFARPAWRMLCEDVAHLVEVPTAQRLWYDDRDIPALAESNEDLAKVRTRDAATINQLITAGFSPESVKAAVLTGDMSQLDHSGLVSVQLLRPGEGVEPAALPAGGDTK